MPPETPHAESTLSRGAVLASGALAGSVAALVEIAAASASGAAPGPALALRQVLWLLAVGLLAGLAVRPGSARYTARLWLVLPTLIALSPMLLRRFGGAAALLVPLAVVALAMSLPAVGRESVIAGALAGSVMGVRWGIFFASEYDGRNTAPRALAMLALTALLAGAIYLVGAWKKRDGRRAGAPALLLAALAVSLLSVGIVWASGETIPRSLEGSTFADTAPPVVVIVLDTVRADHLETYGYARDTMPNLEAFARRSAVTVERAITNAPDSLASHASLFTGLFPIHHGAHRPLLSDTTTSFGYPLRSDVPTLASILQENGYVTLGVSANFGPVSAEIGLGLERGFDLYRSQPEGSCAFARRSPWRPLGQWVSDRLPAASWMPDCTRRYRRADQITDDAIALVDATGESSFFLFVNYMEAHSPYAPPRELRDKFPGYDPALVGQEPPQPSAAGVVDLPARLAAHLISQYDAEIAYLDTQLARLLERLQQHPAWDDMVVVVTADHGEAFGEHGFLDHSSSLYDVMIRVPLIIKAGAGQAGVPVPGSRWQRPFQMVDIMPLALTGVGLALPPDLDGRVPTEPGGPLRAWSFPARAKMRISDSFARELRSIEISGWKLIEDQDGYTELYDLAADPGELSNLAEQEPERVAAMLESMGPWTSYRAENRGPGESLSPEALERLRALGYIR